ncbi:hypothetical protein S7711_06526 [Stachybotrys chartarum IBT 7711]|uniref:N-acetylgalactosaminide beta-1,3-galactosyltransferase n=1 Tax=Stachybotrys chartarum (strain CBS 109288 / IBT 7711) TaxID=1280523 RepID=A0A084B2J2_STACB|nr:hypothetical protein S7711_06526 [Stachybotrys chartarum IBT 7711]KFA71243.1 hypothetical protein S40288_07797 [Stachybotrys chartarum IBT 40288]
MGLVTYKNNRLVPAIIIVSCVFLFFYLLDPAVSHVQTGYRPATIVQPQAGQYVEVSLKDDTKTVPPPAVQHVEPATAPAEPSSPRQYASVNGLAPTDVLLIMKTGGTTMWKRLLIHLTTSLAVERIPRENVVIYSDMSEKIGAFTTVDVLANMSAAAKAMPDFDVYREQPEYIANNQYFEASGVAGDEWGPTGGWIIDKYKFVPLMQHAGENWPRAKWYIYMEDDSYLFLPQVLAYLSGFDWKRPHYLGSYAAKADVTFAHGGAGFAVSRGAWEKTFGQNSHMTEDYYEYTSLHCCGDQVLAYAMDKHGVKFGENDGDGKFTWGFNPVVHWTFAFSRHNWCSPLMSFHKIHSRDVQQYYELERSWDPSKPFLHRDFFTNLILPRIQKRLEWWDNMSGVFQVTSANKAAPPAPQDSKYDAKAWNNGWESVDACEAACKGWVNCVQWSFVEDLCTLDDKMILGQGFAPAMSQRKTSLIHTSGWLPERLDDWAC